MHSVTMKKHTVHIAAYNNGIFKLFL